MRTHLWTESDVIIRLCVCGCMYMFMCKHWSWVLADGACSYCERSFRVVNKTGRWRRHFQIRNGSQLLTIHFMMLRNSFQRKHFFFNFPILRMLRRKPIFCDSSQIRPQCSLLSTSVHRNIESNFRFSFFFGEIKTHTHTQSINSFEWLLLFWGNL